MYYIVFKTCDSDLDLVLSSQEGQFKALYCPENFRVYPRFADLLYAANFIPTLSIAHHLSVNLFEPFHSTTIQPVTITSSGPFDSYSSCPQ